MGISTLQTSEDTDIDSPVVYMFTIIIKINYYNEIWKYKK